MKEVTFTAGESNPILTINPTTGEITQKTAVDTSGFVSTTLNSGRVLVGSPGNAATQVDTASVGDISADTTNGLQIKAGAIVNADINASAAIAYSKLALTGSIVNADVNASAAIAYSKLNLTGSITNADINAAAAIARTKLASGSSHRVIVNNASGVMTDAAAITANRVLVSNNDGIPVAAIPTTTEINRVAGVTSPIQTQLNSNIVGIAADSLVTNPTASEDGYAITWDNTAGEWTLIDPVVTGLPTGGTAGQFIIKNSGTNFDVSWADFEWANISDVSTTLADVELLSGLDAAGLTNAELQNLIGTTSNIQSQLTNKQDRSLTHNSIWVGNVSNVPTALSAGTNGYVLTISSGSPTWQPSVAGFSNPMTTTGDLILGDTGGAAIRLGIGSADHVLRSNGTTASWGTIATGGITNAAVTYAKIQNVAANSFLANATGSSATVQEIATSRIPLFGSAITGTPDGTTFLRGDGTWSTPAGSGDVVGPASSTDNAFALFDGTTGKLLKNSSLTEGSFIKSNGTTALGGSITVTGTQVEDVVFGSLSYSNALNIFRAFADNQVNFAAGDAVGATTDRSIMTLTQSGHIWTWNNAASTSLNQYTIGSSGHKFNTLSSTRLALNTDGTIQINLGSDATGDTYYRNSSGFFTRLGIGTSGQVLTVSGGGLPSWANASSGFSDPMTTRGDIIIRNASNATARLGIGSNGQVLTSDGTDISWQTPSGGGGSWGTISGTLSDQTDLYDQRTVTGADDIVQSDNLQKIYFNSASPFNFTIEELLIGSQVNFINIGAGAVTFVAGTGVTIDGITVLEGGVNATATILYRTATNPLIVGGTIEGEALTKVDDTNVTLTLGGSPSTALLSPASITAGWTGQLSSNRGGSGVNNSGNFTWGSNNITFSTSGATSLTLPTSGTLATTANTWLNGATTTLTGVSTVTSNAAAQHIFDGTWSSNTSAQYHFQIAPTVTYSSNVAHVQGLLNVGGTINAGVNSQVLRGLVINPNYSYGAFTRPSYSNLGLDIRDSNGNGFKFYTDAFTNTNNSFQIVNPSGVTTAEMVVDASGFAITSNSGKTLTLGSGGIFRINVTGTRLVELAAAQSLDISRNLFGPAMGTTATTSTATQRSANANFALQGRVWNGSTALTSYLIETFDASTSVNQQYTSDKRYWTGAAMVDAWRLHMNTTRVNMFLGGITDPTARLHIAAGTTAAGSAPLKLISGTAMTTPEDGAIEYHDSHLYFTIGSTRYQLDQQSGGGIGGSTGSVDNAILRADGTGGSTVQASSVIIDDNGNFTLGTGSIAGGKSITLLSSDANAGLTVTGQGDAFHLITTDTGNVTFQIQNDPLTSLFQMTTTTTAASLLGGFGGTVTFDIRGIQGQPSAVRGSTVRVISGGGYTTGDNDAGDIFLYSGNPNGSGNYGNIGFHASTLADWQDMEQGIYLANATAQPTAGLANGNALYSFNYEGTSELFAFNEEGGRVGLTFVEPFITSSTTFTITEAYRGRHIYFTSGSAVAVTFNALKPGFFCVVIQKGGGTVTVSGASNVTIEGKSATTAQHDAIGLHVYDFDSPTTFVQGS